MKLHAIILNCTLKSRPEKSNTEALAGHMVAAFEKLNVTVEMPRIVDFNVLPGTSSNEGKGDDWPYIHRKIMQAEIVIIATPTWLGHPSSIAQRVLERMDAMMSETDAKKQPVAYNKVAGVVVTGNEDGAHHVVADIAQGLIDIGFTVPGQAWTYWNMGPGPGPSYSETDHGHEWSKSTGEQAVRNLVAAAKAFRSKPLSRKK